VKLYISSPIRLHGVVLNEAMTSLTVSSYCVCIVFVLFLAAFICKFGINMTCSTSYCCHYKLKDRWNVCLYAYIYVCMQRDFTFTYPPTTCQLQERHSFSARHSMKFPPCVKIHIKSPYSADCYVAIIPQISSRIFLCHPKS